MNIPEILDELFKNKQPSKNQLITVLYEEIERHEKGRESSVFPVNRSPENLAYMVMIIWRKYDRFLNQKIDKDRVCGADQTKHIYEITLPEHHKKKFPYEYYRDLTGKHIKKSFWYRMYNGFD